MGWLEPQQQGLCLTRSEGLAAHGTAAKGLHFCGYYEWAWQRGRHKVQAQCHANRETPSGVQAICKLLKPTPRGTPMMFYS